jgi:hypothetical protein
MSRRKIADRLLARTPPGEEKLVSTPTNQFGRERRIVVYFPDVPHGFHLDRERPEIGAFLVGVAAADGDLSPQEIAVLEKVYRLLELPPEDLYSRVHALTVAPPASEPVTVRPGARRTPPRPRRCR